MQMDRLRIGRAGAVALAMASCIGLSSAASAAGGAGQIRLQLGGLNQENGVQVKRWLYIPAEGMPKAENILDLKKNQGAILSQCQYGTDTVSRSGTGFDIVELKALKQTTFPDPDNPEDGNFALGPADNYEAVPGNLLLGVGPDSIGVYDGKSGVPCYRMSGNIFEGIQFGFGVDVVNKLFDRLELDMEVKGDGEFIVDVLDGVNPPRKYYLRSGASIIDGEGFAGPSNPARRIFNCSSASDSGNDSGPNDNCRWIINDVGTHFRLRAKGKVTATEVVGNGEGSLEGGGDYPTATAAYDNNTVIYLATLSDRGDLTCDKADGTLVTSANDNLTAQVGAGITPVCRVTRIASRNSLAFPQACDKPFPYLLTAELDGRACEIIQIDPNTQEPVNPDGNLQIAASVEIKFPPETRTELQKSTEGGKWALSTTEGSCSSTSGSCPPAKRTSVQFTVPGPALTAPFFPERCEGTVVPDDNNNLTIAEVFTYLRTGIEPSGWVNPLDDVYPATSALEWACILDSRIEYVGTNQQQRTDIVLFWGDARFSAGFN